MLPVKYPFTEQRDVRSARADTRQERRSISVVRMNEEEMLDCFVVLGNSRRLK